MAKAAPETIYLNAAGHGLPDESVRARMMAHLAREAEVGPERAAREAQGEIEAVRGKAAKLLGAHEDEVAFTGSTTLGWGMAAGSLPLTGRRILVAPHEWVTNVAILQRLPAAHGMTLDVLPLGEGGDLDLTALKAMLEEDVAAICLPVVSSITGRRYPVEAVGALPRPETCFYLLDAAQALGQTPLDVHAIGCDMLAATARKWLRAPRGTALLHVSRATLERMKPVPFPDTGLTWRPDARDFTDGGSAARFEGFDANVMLRLGLGAAIDIAAGEGVAAIAKRISALAAHVRERTGGAGIALFSPGEAQSGITTLLLPEGVAEGLPARLDAAGIVAKLPALRDEPLAPPPPEGKRLLRVSPHVYNTHGHIDALFDMLESG